MNIHEANPNFKNFLFLLLIMFCGIFSILIAFFLQNPSQLINEHFKKSATEGNQPSVMHASLFASPDQDDHFDIHAKCTLTGTVVPFEKVMITAIRNQDTLVTFTNTEGQFRMDRMDAGDYQLRFEPVRLGSIKNYQIDVVNLDPGASRDLGILEIKEN